MMVSEKKCDNFMWSNIFENGYAKPIFCNTFFEKCAKNFIFGNGCYYLLYYYPQLLESIYSHNLIAFQCDKIFNFQGKIHKTFTSQCLSCESKQLKKSMIDNTKTLTWHLRRSLFSTYFFVLFVIFHTLQGLDFGTTSFYQTQDL